MVYLFVFVESPPPPLITTIRYKLMPMQNVHLKFTVDLPSGPVANCTSDSKKPSASNPNFLERIVVPVRRRYVKRETHTHKKRGGGIADDSLTLK